MRRIGGGVAARFAYLRLVYTSLATSTLSEQDLREIEEASRRQNDEAGLTGFLLFDGRGFHGVLEGRRARVLERMEAIVQDPRHKRLAVLSETPAQHRRFANWTYGSIAGSAEPGPDLPSAQFLRTLVQD